MKTPYPPVFDRLDQAFAFWDEEMWMLKVTRHVRSLRKSGALPLPHQNGYPVDGREHTRAMLINVMSPEGLDALLPKTLLKLYDKQPEFGEEDIDQIEQLSDWDNPRHGEFEANVLWDTFHFPYHLGRWNASSRRIYYLTEELMMQLRVTSLRGMTLRDLHVPHDAFAIALETPIRHEENGTELDFFLVGKHSLEGYAYYGMPSSLANWKSTDPVLRAKINDAMLKGNRKRFLALVLKLREGNHLHDNWVSLSNNKDLGFESADLDTDLEALSESIAKQVGGEKYIQWYLEFFRVFVGLCIYLKSFESRKGLIQPESYPKMSSKLTRFGPALHAESEVCRVQNFMHMTPDEREIIRQYLSGKGGWEVCAHFRRGYWRRRSGEGHDPNAEKIVRVPPTLVRKDRLPEGALALGKAQEFA